MFHSEYDGIADELKRYSSALALDSMSSLEAKILWSDSDQDEPIICGVGVPTENL